MAVHMNDQERRGALNDLAALAHSWERRARVAERAAHERMARVFFVGALAGASTVLGFWLGLLP